MSQAIMPTLELPLPPAGRSLWGEARKRVFRNPVNSISFIVVCLYFFVALVCYSGLIDSQIDGKVGDSMQPPTFDHFNLWLGTDILGRSVLWRVIYGTRVGLTIGVVATLLETILGVTFGLFAGYFGGIVDSLITWLYSTVNTVPWLLLVISLAYVLKGQEYFGVEIPPLAIVIIALGTTGWVNLTRLVRGEVLKLRDADYVTAARAVGVRTPSIFFIHILPNLMHLVIINATIAAVGYMQSEVILAFLGLSVKDKPTWGDMIDSAKMDLMRGVWWQIAGATVALYIISQALNFLGDALRDAFDPRLRGVK